MKWRKMFQPSSCAINELNSLLLKGTDEHSCKWERLTPFCVYTIIGDYGFFLTKFPNIVLLDIYYGNQIYIKDVPRRELEDLLIKGFAQAIWRDKLTREEIARFNMNAAARKKRAENLRLDIYRLMDLLKVT